MYYLYNDHTGGQFYTTKALTDEERYCESCNDEDVLVKTASTLSSLKTFAKGKLQKGQAND